MAVQSVLEIHGAAKQMAAANRIMLPRYPKRNEETRAAGITFGGFEWQSIARSSCLEVRRERSAVISSDFFGRALHLFHALPAHQQIVEFAAPRSIAPQSRCTRLIYSAMSLRETREMAKFSWRPKRFMGSYPWHDPQRLRGISRDHAPSWGTAGRDGIQPDAVFAIHKQRVVIANTPFRASRRDHKSEPQFAAASWSVYQHIAAKLL